MFDGSSTFTGGTKLPSIMKNKQGAPTSGAMLRTMMMGNGGSQLSDKKRLPRNVSEAALKLINALDRVE